MLCGVLFKTLLFVVIDNICVNKWFKHCMCLTYELSKDEVLLFQIMHTICFVLKI